MASSVVHMEKYRTDRLSLPECVHLIAGSDVDNVITINISDRVSIKVSRDGSPIIGELMKRHMFFVLSGLDELKNSDKDTIVTAINACLDADVSLGGSDLSSLFQEDDRLIIRLTSMREDHNINVDVRIDKHFK